MLILWAILVATTDAQKVYESTEDIGPEAFLNVTTLYPISNKTSLNTTHNDNNLSKNDSTTSTTTVSNITSEINLKGDKGKIDATVWKIEAAFAESNLDKHEKENVTKDNNSAKNVTKEFRPSPHLGSFFDEDIPPVSPTRASYGTFQPLKKPSAGFVSSISEDQSFHKIHKQILQSHKPYPYKFETPILPRLKDPWKTKGHEESLESRPTAEIPVRVPAGGLYKYQDLLQEKPGDDDNFGLEFGDGKDNAIKKRQNPWENFLRLVTAFLPVGLIISALTPSIITIENSAAVPGHTYPSNIYRRTDPEPGLLPHISERCRRRLLCELHSDHNYKTESNGPPRGKPCYKVRCEDPQALAKTLRWLLDYRLYTEKGQHSYN